MHKIPFPQFKHAILATGGELQTRSEAHEAQMVLTVGCLEKDHGSENVGVLSEKQGSIPSIPKQFKPKAIQSQSSSG